MAAKPDRSASSDPRGLAWWCELHEKPPAHRRDVELRLSPASLLWLRPKAALYTMARLFESQRDGVWNRFHDANIS